LRVAAEPDQGAKRYGGLPGGPACGIAKRKFHRLRDAGQAAIRAEHPAPRRMFLGGGRYAAGPKKINPS